MPAGRCAAEIVVEGDDAVHLGARQVQRLGDQRHRLAVDVAELLLDGVQDRQQRARHRLPGGNDAAGGLGIPGRVRMNGYSPPSVDV